MLRALIVFALVATATLRSGTAHAWRMVCEADPTPTSVPAGDSDISSGLDDALPPVAPAWPFGHDICLSGATYDPSCWPDERLPVRGGHIFFGSVQTFTVVSGASPPGGPSPRLYVQRSAILSLADGHERRLERPPRFV